MSNTKYPRRGPDSIGTLRGRQIQNTKYKKGMGLVELVVVVGVAALILFSFSQIVFLSNLVFGRSENLTKALHLAEEGMEAARIFRDRTNWPSNGLGSLTVGNSYHPAISGGDWVLAAGSEIVANQFERIIRMERVYRDANDNIVSSGTEDQNSRKVTVIVRGIGPIKIPEVRLATYLMNWR